MNRKSLLFAAKFLVLFFSIYALLFILDISFLQNGIASFEAALAGLPNAGNAIFLGNHIFVIVESCTGFVSIAMIFAIIFSLKKPVLKLKILIFLICSFFLFLINLGRIWIVVYSAAIWGADAAQWIHVISWFMMSGAVLALWYYFTKRFFGEDFSQLL